MQAGFLPRRLPNPPTQRQRCWTLDGPWPLRLVPPGPAALLMCSPALEEECSSPPLQTSCSDLAVSSPPPLSSRGGGRRDSWFLPSPRWGGGCSSTRVSLPVASLGPRSPRKGPRVEYGDPGLPGQLALSPGAQGSFLYHEGELSVSRCRLPKPRDWPALNVI